MPENTLMNSRNSQAPVPTHSRRLFAIQVSAVALSILLTGCSYSDLKPQSRLQPAEDAGETLAQSGITLSPAAWPAETWWTSFNDKQHDSLVDEALAQSTT